MRQIIPVLEGNDGTYRMKVARQWVTLLKWDENGSAILTGLKHRSSAYSR